MLDYRDFVRSLIPIKIKRLISRFGHSLNYEIFLDDLVKSGITIEDIIDVGAADGQFARLMIKYFRDFGNLYLIEPREDKARQLEKKFANNNVMIFNDVITRDSRTIDFSFKGNASSFVDVGPNEQTLKIQSSTMKEIFKDHSINNGLLKIDVQGAELEVLESMGDLLDQINAVIIEVNTRKLSDKQVLMIDVLNFLSDRNFRFYSVGHMHRDSHERVFQIDMCLLRSDSE